MGQSKKASETDVDLTEGFERRNCIVPGCGREFLAKRSDQRYCSDKCRQDLHNRITRDARREYFENHPEMAEMVGRDPED